MLKGLMKKAGILPDANKEEVDMSVQDKALTVELATHEAVVAELATLQEQMTEALASVESVKAELAEAKAMLEQASAEKADMAAKAKEQLSAARLSQLEAIVGNEKATAVMASLGEADEATFNTVVGAMAASYKAEAESDLFVEKGLDATPAPVVEKDAVQRLADNLAAQFKTVN